MKKSRKYLISLIILSLLLVSLITIIACPSVNETPPTNVITVSGELTSSKWSDILDGIYTKGIYAQLDLSACKVPASGGGDVLKRVNEDGSNYTPTNYPGTSTLNPYNDYIQFNPSLSSRYGKDLITSIVLPDVATMISNASNNIDIETIKDAVDDETNSYAFRHFKNLKSISGKKISLIGSFAFLNCTSLEKINFPNLVIVMQYAFYNCVSFKEAKFEKLRHIQPSAFENCRSLEKAEFHNADRVSQRAFKGCTNLKEIYFSNVIEVEFEAFRDCTSLRIARFHKDIAPRTSIGHPLQRWKNNLTPPYSEDTLAFHNNAFRGCVSLNMLDVRNAWNVYFGGGALADIGTHLDLYLYDDGGEGTTTETNQPGKSYGHPQVELLLGRRSSTQDLNVDVGNLTLKTLKIIASAIKKSDIPPYYEESTLLYNDVDVTIPTDEDGDASIRNRINAVYNPGDREINYNEPKNPVVKVTVERRPSF